MAVSASKSVRDIRTISQLAWRLKCAFTDSPSSSPPEFQEVEKELKGLSTALDKLAGTLDRNGSALLNADGKLRDGLSSISASCFQTLEDLDTFIDSYQDSYEVEQPGGIKTTQCSWRPFLLKHYNNIIWTSQGGNIQSLRSLLAMHIQSIALAMEAVRNPSLLNIIDSVAEQVVIIHGRITGDPDHKLEEIRKALSFIESNKDSASAAASPTSWSQRRMYSATRSPASPHAASPPIPPRSGRRVPSNASTQDPLTPQATPDLSDSDFSGSPQIVYRESQASSFRPDRLSDKPLPDPFYQLPRSWTEHPTDERKISSISRELEKVDLSAGTRTDSLQENRESSSTIPIALSLHPPLSPRSPASPTDEDPFAGSATVLPPPSLPISSPSAALELDPFHKIRMFGKPSLEKQSPDHGDSQQARAAFEKAIFTHSAVLCDVQGSAVEYTQPDVNRPGDFVMEKACDRCRICLVTKTRKLTDGNVRYSSSIWALSENGEIRLQQKIPEEAEVIPYTVWDNHTKVVLRLKAQLDYHDIAPESRPTKKVETAWINYIFPNENAAIIFQNALMNKTHILSVRTRRTMRLFNGVSGAFTFAEQLCGLENLRIFYDPNTNVAYGMIHYVPDFAEGYMTIPLNDPRNAIRVREENNTTIRIKGLKIPLKEKVNRRPSTSEARSKQRQEKFLTGAKIEFFAQVDKDTFMAELRKIQDNFLGTISGQ